MQCGHYQSIYKHYLLFHALHLPFQDHNFSRKTLLGKKIYIHKKAIHFDHFGWLVNPAEILVMKVQNILVLLLFVRHMCQVFFLRVVKHNVQHEPVKLVIYTHCIR